jgi:hypothetical protein
MSTKLSFLCAALIVSAPLGLLAIRFLWPKFMPWWSVVLITACLSWGLVTTLDHLSYGVLLDEVAECRAAAAKEPPPGPDCPTPFVDYWSWPNYLKWVPGITWLLLWLPIYGAARVLVKRFRASAT